MLNRLILKVTKFQLPPPKRLGTVVKNILGGHDGPPMSNRVNSERTLDELFCFCYNFNLTAPYNLVIAQITADVMKKLQLTTM